MTQDKRTPTRFKDMTSYLHGSNKINYTTFVCACCGNEDKFGKIACLSCHAEIITAVNAHAGLVFDLKSANEFIRRALEILTPDQAGYCGFYRPNPEALRKAGAL